MSVVFKPILSADKTKRYQILITLNTTSWPEEDLKCLTEEIISVLRDADMDGMDKNYFRVLDLLRDMIPDRKTFESLTNEPDSAGAPAVV